MYARYQRILTERNGLDFDDLLMKAALLLENDSNVRRELADRFRYLLIDEYQDTNHAQYRLAKALVAHHRNICVVGRSRSVDLPLAGRRHPQHPGFRKGLARAQIVTLEENFRSTAAILRAADKLIACNRNRKHKSLMPVRSHEGQSRVECYEDEAGADAVARRIQELSASGVSGRDIAVFYRINAMSRALEEAFIRRRVAVPGRARRRVLQPQGDPRHPGLSEGPRESGRRGRTAADHQHADPRHRQGHNREGQEYAARSGIPLFDAPRNADGPGPGRLREGQAGGLSCG